MRDILKEILARADRLYAEEHMNVESASVSIKTLTVSIKAVTVNNKQMTLAVFRQLPEIPPHKDDVVWGYVEDPTYGTYGLFERGGVLCRRHRAQFTGDVFGEWFQDRMKERGQLFIAV